jgi:hypothetical protein
LKILGVVKGMLRRGSVKIFDPDPRLAATRRLRSTTNVRYCIPPSHPYLIFQALKNTPVTYDTKLAAIRFLRLFIVIHATILYSSFLEEESSCVREADYSFREI